MEPRISLITLGVSDLERSVAFYRDGLGLPTEGIIGREFEHGAVAFFPLAGGLRLALWAQADLAFDTGLQAAPVSPTGFALAHNVLRRSDVDAVMAAAGRAGPAVSPPPSASCRRPVSSPQPASSPGPGRGTRRAG